MDTGALLIRMRISSFIYGYGKISWTLRDPLLRIGYGILSDVAESIDVCK